MFVWNLIKLKELITLFFYLKIYSNEREHLRKAL